MNVKRVFTPFVLLAGVSAAFAQAPGMRVPAISAAPRKVVEPGPTPTPGPEIDRWTEYMLQYHEVQKVPKDKAIRISDKYAKPNPVTPWKMEIVGEDEHFLYLRNLPVEDPESPAHKAWLYHENQEAYLTVTKEQEEKYFILDPFAELMAPPFTDRLRFEDHSQGLPTQGKWQMGFAYADFNRDGREDLVFPPSRMGTPFPTIFLATDAGWQAWAAVRWPQAHFDYGDVGVADFDGDGNLDLALACHFLRNYVLYGNGKGDFTRFSELPRVNPNVTSRALEIADFDGDKRPDIAFLCELDLQMGTNRLIGGGLLFVCLNTKGGWQAVDASGGRQNLHGDQIAVGDFDADGDADLLIASHKNINRFFVYLNGGDGRTWTAQAPPEFPFRAYLQGVAAGNLDRVPGDEAVMGFFQNVQSGSHGFPRNAIAVYSFIVGPDGMEVKERRLLDVDAAEYDKYTCAAVGDLDGDGLLDLVLGRQAGGIKVFLQAPDGAFLEERGGEFNLGDVWVNSVKIVSLTAKGPKTIVAGTSDSKKNPGSIRCWVVRRAALDSGRRAQ